MNTPLYGLTMSLAILASGVSAEVTLNVDGTDIPLATLMENCKSMGSDPGAQIACFNALTQLIDEQSGGSETSEGASVPDALEALRTVAAYQDDETGLLINGADCNVQIVYYGNYFHISRRNISEIDLFSAAFDASQLQLDQTDQGQGGAIPLSKGVMADGATAAMHGGAALDSAQNNFAPRSPRTSLDVYAVEVVDQLAARDAQSFDFVLVHPQRSDDSDAIWSAFDGFVSACKG